MSWPLAKECCLSAHLILNHSVYEGMKLRIRELANSPEVTYVQVTLHGTYKVDNLQE